MNGHLWVLWHAVLSHIYSIILWTYLLRKFGVWKGFWFLVLFANKINDFSFKGTYMISMYESFFKIKIEILKLFLFYIMLVYMFILDYPLCWLAVMLRQLRWNAGVTATLLLYVVLCGGAVVSHFYLTQCFAGHVTIINHSFPGQVKMFVILILVTVQ